MTPATKRIDVLGLTRAELIERAGARLLRGAGLAAGVHADAHAHARFDPARLGASPAVCAAWASEFEIAGLTHVATRGTPDDDAQKAVFATADRLEIETVRIDLGRGRTAQCLSSQVGCAMACRFCETGLLGRLRNLRAAEIVAQVVYARARLRWRPSSLVFQGMGEPFDNFDQVMQSIDVLCDGSAGGFGRDRITLCTAGHADGIRRLRERGVGRVNLSLSLTIADDERRAEWMPITRRWPLAEVQDALRSVRPRDNWQLGLHVCLLPGVNDSEADARRIADFARPLGRVMVHVIPYNPTSLALARAPTEREIVRFVERLRQVGLPVRRRITKGRTAMAACGQLGNRALARGSRRPLDRRAEFPDQDSNLD
ncbi:MAG: radical SAM protein [Planctomycetota bacterium]